MAMRGSSRSVIGTRGIATISGPDGRSSTLARRMKERVGPGVQTANRLVAVQATPARSRYGRSSNSGAKGANFGTNPRAE